jgi:hypothetical protein
MNDELRRQLQHLDPMPPDVPMESVTAPAARERLENIMSTSLIERPNAQTPADPGAPWWRRPALLGAAAAAVAVLAVGAIVATGGDGDVTDQVAAGPPLELSLGDSNAMAMCIVFDVDILADMSPAFAGTATAIDGETVTLSVDRWYAGGDAATVQLNATPGMQALIDGFDFEVGQQYLITAANGTVNFCGYSGLATPELTAAFDQAFGG